MGYDAPRPFSYAPIAFGTSPLFRTWLGGGRGLRLNRASWGLTHGLGLLMALSRLKRG